jgi:hypothetical protein
MTSDATLIAFFVVLSSPWLACATAKSPKSVGVAATREPSAIIGPECPAVGPTVDATITLFQKGKPPHLTFAADLRVRNPSTAPVWLLYDVGDSDTFPSMVTSVALARKAPGHKSLGWSFGGDGAFQAVRIPGGASLLLRDTEFSTFERDRPAALVFASQISIDGQPAEEWFGRPGLLPATGDISLSPGTPDWNTEHEWHGESLNAPALRVDVRCVSHVNLPPEVNRP